MAKKEGVNQVKNPSSNDKPASVPINPDYQQTNLYKCVFNRMNDALALCKVVYDEKGEAVDFIVLDVNLAFKRLLRVSEENVLGQKASLILPNLTHMHLAWMARCCEAVQKRKTITMEKHVAALNKWLNFNGYSPQKGYFAVVIEDVTWRRKTEEAFRLGEKKYKKLADSITDPFFAVDSSLTINYWNRASEKAMDISAQQVLGKHFFEVFGKNKATRKTAGVYLDVMRTKNPRKLIDKLPNAGDNAVFEIEVYPTGNGICVLAKDVTEQHKRELSLEEYAKRLEELVKIRTEKLNNAERLAAIGETAGMIGHDIRNPLQSIISELFLAKDELGELPETQTKENLLESINAIEEQTLYINKIVTDLQDYAKPLTPAIQETDLEQVIRDVTAEINIPSNVKVAYPILKPIQMFKTDPSFIKRILSNLMRNGIQAMEEKGGELTVNTFPRIDSIIIAVSDTGTGIPEEVKDRIFKPLFTTKSKGQGFGLPVVKKLTEALGGSVSFDSKVGAGTTFIVELPLHLRG
jgi:PAS domain S-box-containing protein